MQLVFLLHLYVFSFMCCFDIFVHVSHQYDILEISIDLLLFFKMARLIHQKLYFIYFICPRFTSILHKLTQVRPSATGLGQQTGIVQQMPSTYRRSNKAGGGGLHAPNPRKNTLDDENSLIC